MKKTLKMLLVAAMMLAIATSVNAATTSEVVKYLTSAHMVAGQSIVLPDTEKVKVERYFEQYPVSEANGDQIIANCNSIIAIMDAAGTADPQILSVADKQKVMDLANAAAEAAGVTLTFKNGTIEVYKDGKLIETVNFNGTTGGKLAYTGNSNMLFVVVPGVVLIAGAIFLISKKGLKSAK